MGELREDLKPHMWPKGKSGNPGGRPKLKSQTLESALRDRVKRDPVLMTKLVDALIGEILKGSAPHLKILAERLGGTAGENVYDREEQQAGVAGATRTLIFNDEDNEDDDDGQSADIPST